MKAAASILFGFLGMIGGLCVGIIPFMIFADSDRNGAFSALFAAACVFGGCVLGATYPYRKGKKREEPITARQEEYLLDLCEENPHLACELDLSDDIVSGLSKADASAFIQQFMDERRQGHREQ